MVLNVESSDLAVPARRRRRAIAAAAAGTLIENYDNYLYGVLVVVISVQLFPPGGHATLAALATYSVTFLARPVGAVIFGRIADRAGRRSALFSSLIAMAVGTVLVGVIPTYASVGYLAPISLIFLRLLQGVSMGGEVGSASVFVGEYVARERRGLFGSLVFMSAQFGNVLAIIVVLVLQLSTSEQAFASWGWRIAFLLAALPAVAIGYLRLKTDETPVFRGVEGEKPSHVPLRRALVENWRGMLQIAGLGGMASPFLLISTYLPIYFRQAGLSAVGSTVALLIINSVVAGLVPLAGALGDRIGRKTEFLLSGGLMLVLVVPAFALAGAGSLVSALAGGLLLALPIVLFFGAFPATLAELFETETRGTGANVGYGFGTVVFATLPLVVAAITDATGNRLAPAFCVAVVAVIGLTAAVALPRNRLTGEHHLDQAQDLRKAGHA